MQCLFDGGTHGFAKGVRQHGRLDGGVNFIDVAHAATQNNAIWVQQVDHLRQGTAQAVGIALKTLYSLYIPLAHGFNNLQSALVPSRNMGMVTGKTTATDPSL
jgi:hypothetical protein